MITVDTSDEPYGLLTIAPSSLRVTTEERDRIINIYVSREFGASGQWKKTTQNVKNHHLFPADFFFDMLNYLYYRSSEYHL